LTSGALTGGGSAHERLIRGNRVVKQIFHCRKFRGPRLYIHNATSNNQEPRVECEIGHQTRKIVLPLRLEASEKLESRTTTSMSRHSLYPSDPSCKDILFCEQVKNNFAAVGSCGPSTQIEIATEYKQLQNIESIKDLVE